jgi:hypothetical protein
VTSELASVPDLKKTKGTWKEAVREVVVRLDPEIHAGCYHGSVHSLVREPSSSNVTSSYALTNLTGQMRWAIGCRAFIFSRLPQRREWLNEVPPAWGVGDG